ncbi:hypothetical protein LDENG_00262630, partial [Lucifuga dentata]
MEVWKVGKTFLIHCSSSMLWEMIVSNITCMKINVLGSNMLNGWYDPLIIIEKSALISASVCNSNIFCTFLL